MQFMEKYFLNFSLSLDHVALSLHCVPIGAYNTVYLARSCPRSTHICQKLIDFQRNFCETSDTRKRYMTYF
jgi:hypothetical protein